VVAWRAALQTGVATPQRLRDMRSSPSIGSSTAARSAFKLNIVKTTRALRELFNSPLFLDMVDIAHEAMPALLDQSHYTSTPNSSRRGKQEELNA